MYGQQLITYQQIADKVLAYCIANSANYQTLDKLPAYYKQGYSRTENITLGAFVQTNITRRISNSIIAVSDETIRTDIQVFLRDVLKLEPYLSYQVNNVNFFNYLSDMASFCCTKLCYVVSNDYNVGYVTEANASKIPNDAQLVYVSSNSDYRNLIAMNFEGIREATNVTYAVDEVDSQLQSLINSMGSTVYKTVNNKCTFTLGSTLIQ